MKQFANYFIAVICAISIATLLLKTLKVIFNSKWMTHPVFEFPQDRWRRAILLICGMFVLFLWAIQSLGYLDTCD